MVKKKPKAKNTKPSTVAKQTSSSSVDNSINDKVRLSTAPSSVFMKVCRLCETRDGPFLNIFDMESSTAKKIEELMPFRVAENDGLPHKICFRCSAKIEELYEFIQKCIKTQENLRSALGNKEPLVMKTKTTTLWEEKLNKNNLANDDICDTLIRKAMEGIKDLPLRLLNDEKFSVKKPKAVDASRVSLSDDEHDEISLKQVKLSVEKCDEKVKNTHNKTETSQDPNLTNRQIKSYPSKRQKVDSKTDENKKESCEKEVARVSEKEEPKKEAKKSFNIMDHVCTIKVHGVGILFQCKLCNRNFLKKEVVESHACAKHHGPKDAVPQTTSSLPEPPKPTTVKYITMDKDFKKADLNKKVEMPDVPKPVQPEVRPKPKIGPASKVKRQTEDTPPQSEVPAAPVVPSVTFPAMPSLNSRYKLVPGPNNSFTLVEEPATNNASQENPPPVLLPVPTASPVNPPVSKVVKVKKLLFEGEPSKCSAKIIDIDGSTPATVTKEQPYPVGLFQTVSRRSSTYPSTEPPTFTTPAMKKQSYTVVQTGNPSKLLISTKPQPVEEPLKKKSKKHKLEESKEPYNVTLEENPTPKNGTFFTFVNLDPLLQPSYVLPTDNIIQESQISTSTPGSKPVNETVQYTCNMCNEQFSREKKLLTHIQSHYNQMDEEDQKRTVPKKKSKKS